MRLPKIPKIPPDRNFGRIWRYFQPRMGFRIKISEQNVVHIQTSLMSLFCRVNPDEKFTCWDSPVIFRDNLLSGLDWGVIINRVGGKY